MAEFVVIERHNPVLGLTHSVFRKGEPSGVAICLCYNEAQATLVSAALAAYTPVSLPAPARLPEPVAPPAVQAPKPKAKQSPGTQAKKTTPKRQGRKPA